MDFDRVYEDFEPSYEWAKDEGRFTVFLPGYRKDQLKVQVTSKPALKLMGERLIIGNRWLRFALEIPIPSYYDTDNVTATFEIGSLSVKFATLSKPVETTNPPEEAPSRPKEPSQKAAQEDTPKAKEDKAKEDKAEERTNEVSDQKTQQKEEEEAIDETEKGKTETAASKDKVTEEARTSGSTETKAPKTKDAKSVKRSKTRLIDFTLGSDPSNQVEDEALGASAAGLNKWKKLVIWIMLILLVVGLGLYGRKAFRSLQGEWNFQEQELLFPY